MINRPSSTVDRLFSYARRWDLTIERHWETSTSALAFVRRHGTNLVLKVIKQADDEWHSGDILRAFGTDGTVKVYESSPGAVLVERLDPGYGLVDLVRRGDDEAATGIFAEVIQRLAHHAPPTGCATIFDWSRGFDRYLSTVSATGGPISIELATQAANIYKRLASSQTNTMLLHGDLQHYNVLFDATRGWIAIDPKGVVGELEYEVGAIMRNPIELPDLFTSAGIIERRLRTLTNALQLDHQRALEWTFAQSVLSAIWDLEDGHAVSSEHPTLTLARTLKSGAMSENC